MMTSKMLAWAVQSRDVPRVAIGIQRCLQEGLSIDQCKDARGRSPLSVAAANGDMEIVKMLLDAGASVAYLHEESVMLGAIERGQTDFVELLLVYGVRVTPAALETAAAAGHVDIVNALLTANSDCLMRVESPAATNGHGADVVDTIIKTGDTTANVNIQCIALVAAAIGGHMAVVQRLLEEEKPSGDAHCITSVSALVHALCLGHTDIVDVLLARMDDSGDANAIGCVARTGRCLQRLLARPHSIVSVDLLPTPARYDKPVFIFAVESGRVDIVEMLVNAGADVDQRQSVEAQQPLRVAAHHGHDAVVDFLLSRGARMTAQTTAQDTPLMAATAAGHAAIVKKLLRAGANVGWDEALVVASEFGHTEIVELLVNAGGNVNAVGRTNITALAFASMGGHAATVGKLLDRGAYPDLIAISIWNQDSPFRYLPLLVASYRGYADIVDLLLAAGANIHLASNFERTPILAAARFGHLDVVERLLAAGADATDPEVLVEAAKGGDERVVDMLLAAGANLETPGRPRYSALYQAGRRGHLGVVKKLLAAGARLEYAGVRGDGVFKAACKKGDLELVETLIDAGIVSEYQTRAIEAAARGNHVEVLELLVSRGFDVASGDTLSVASSSGALSAVRFLLAHSCESWQLRQAGQAAAKAGHVDVVQELLENGVRALDVLSYALWTSRDNEVVHYLCSSPSVGVLDVADKLEWTWFHPCRGIIGALVGRGADIDNGRRFHRQSEWIRAVISTNQPIEPPPSW